ncbi:MAG: hypothetical protein AAGG75_19220 [Bacteroidota bacterium]
MKKCGLLLLPLLLIAFLLPAQSIDVEQLKGMKIRNIGPAGMSGRVTSIDVDLSNPDVIYAGTASGGLWKSVSGGIDWKPIFDKEALQAIGSVTINQRNPSEIWVGTGEGNPRNSLNTGKGIYKSLDGGKTWQLMGLEKTRLIHRIIIHRDNPDVIFVAALGSAWGPNPERGVYRTKDGGKTWEKILYIDENTGVADMVTDPTNPNKLIVAMWEFGRQPWFFNSGGEGSGLHITHDGGDTWKQITDKEGLPKGELGRIGLAIAPSKPNIVYALIEAKKNGFYKSTDGGNNWTKVSDKNIGNRPFYYADIFVDPKNENRIFNLYSVVSKSEDGGKNFKVILPYFGGRGVHPDHHAFWIHPDHPNFMIEGNDGGLNISRDGGDTWRFIENLPLAQFYHINHDMDIPYNVMGGMQDNGSWVGPSAVWKSGGIRNSDWREVLFGDGFDVMPQRNDNRYGWAMSQGGNLAHYDRETGDNQYQKPIHPDGTELRFNWNAGIAQNPFHDCGIYYGSQFLHKSMDCGKSWTIISPDLTTNDTSKQQQANSGGLTLDVTNAENFTTILSIAPSPVDEQVIWVGTDDGNLQLTRDGGASWNNLASRLPGCPSGSWIPQIEVSQKNAGEAFVIVNNYRRNDWTPYAYHTNDYGQTWRRIVDGNKVSGYTLAIVQDPVEPGLLFLGTDYGLYFSLDGGDHWNKWMNDFPSVQVSDLKIHPREHDLIVGTFGRSAWVLDDIRPLRELARTKGATLEQAFKAFPSPDAYMASYRSVDGGRFIGGAQYVGDNRRWGAMLTLWVKEEKTAKKPKAPEVEKKKDKKKKKKKKKEAEETDEVPTKGKEAGKKKGKKPEKVKVQVFDSQGDTLYTFRRPLQPGINRIYWRMTKKGVRYPSRRKVKPDADDPSGSRVMPGTYKLVFTYGEHKDSTEVKVLADPRLDVSESDLHAREAAAEAFRAIVTKASEGFARLQEAQKTVKLVDEQMINVPDSTKKEIAKMGKTMKDSISQLMNLYMNPENTKGIIRSSDKLNSYLYRANRYISDSKGAPNQMAQLTTEQAKAKVEEVLGRINAFFDKDWAAYQEAVEQVQYSLFKAYDPIKLDE